MADVTASLGIEVYVDDKRAGVAAALAKMNQDTAKFTRGFGGSFRDVSSTLRRVGQEVRFFGGALAGALGVSFSTVALGNEIGRLIQEWRAGEEALKQFAAQQRISGVESADLTEQVKKLAAANREALGATVEDTAKLAQRARAIGLGADEIGAAVTAAQTLNKVLGTDSNTVLDSVAKGLLGSKDAMAQLGVEMGLRITNADEFAAALRRLRAELLDRQAAASERFLGTGAFSQAQAYSMPGSFDFAGAEARARSEIARLRAEAAELRKESLSPQGKFQAEKEKEVGSLFQSSQKLSQSFSELARSASLTDAIPDRLAGVASKTEQELRKLEQQYRETAKKIDESSTGLLFDPLVTSRLQLAGSYGKAVSALKERQANEERAILREQSDYEVRISGETRMRLAEGRERDLLEIENGYDDQQRALDDAHRRGLLSEQTYQNARLGLMTEAERKRREISGTFEEGFASEARRIGEGLLDEYGKGRKAVDDLANALGNNLGDALYGVASGSIKARDAWRSFISGLGNDLLRSASQNLSAMATQLLFGLLGGAVSGSGGSGGISGSLAGVAASGGWFDGQGWHGDTMRAGAFASAARGARVRAFADGGVVSGPTLGLFGERGPEAFVPLRGGRIPVSLHGGGGGSPIYIQISAIDTQSGLQFLHQHRENLWRLQRDGFDRRSEFRGMPRRT